MLINLNAPLRDVIFLLSEYINWIVFFIAVDSIGSIRKKDNRLFIKICLILLVVTIFCWSKYFKIYESIMYMFIGFIYYKSVYEEDTYNIIIYNLSFWFGIIIIKLLSMFVVFIKNDISHIEILLFVNKYTIESIVLAKVLLLIVILVVKRSRLLMRSKTNYNILISVPIVSNILSMLLIILYNLNNKTYDKTNLFLIMSTILLIALSSIVLLVIISKIYQIEKIKLENKIIKERINASYRHYEEMRYVHNRVRYMYHDLKNHMTCIKNYNSKEEIEKYIDNLNLEIMKFEYLKETGNNTLDIIISEKKYKCNKYNIDFEYYINVSKLGFINEIDICSIFSNALDNAIEACANIDKDINKKIEVKVTYVNKFCIMKFVNTKKNNIKIRDNSIQTTKKDNNKHGIGLASIEHVVNKYDGEVLVNYSDDEFILKIMIPIKE